MLNIVVYIQDQQWQGQDQDQNARTSGEHWLSSSLSSTLC